MKIHKVPYDNKLMVIDWFRNNGFELHKDFEFDFQLDTIYTGHYNLTFENKTAEFWYTFAHDEKNNDRR